MREKAEERIMGVAIIFIDIINIIQILSGPLSIAETGGVFL